MTPSEASLKRINIRGALREGNSSGRFFVKHIEPDFDQYRGCLFKVPDMGNDQLGHRWFFVPDQESTRKNGDYFQGVPTNKPKIKKVPYPNHWEFESDFWDFEAEFNKVGYEGSVTFRQGKKPIAFIEKYFKVAGVKDDSQSLVLDYFAGSGSTGHAVINMNRKDDGRRKYILVEMGDYFDTVTKPRIQKAIYSQDWIKDRPKNRKGSSHCFKTIRLESYEDSLNNLDVNRSKLQQDVLNDAISDFKEHYILRYMLDVETRGSQTLLNVHAFADPTAYNLKIKRPGSDESKVVNVDLLETFNWLIGLNVRKISSPQKLSATFERDKEGRLRLKSNGLKLDDNGPYWFRTVSGITSDGLYTFIIWRKLTHEQERDNLVLNEWFARQIYFTGGEEFDQIYVNGSNNLKNLSIKNNAWKVRLIEEDFFRFMFDMEDLV